MTTALAPRRTRITKARKNAIANSRASGFVSRRNSLPEFLTKPEIDALLSAAPDGVSRLIMLTEWRAGLRISEALALESQDIFMDDDNPTLVVFNGKGSKSRTVPLHPELRAALRLFMAYSPNPRGQIFRISRSTAYRRIKDALGRAKALNAIGPDRNVHDHTLRHSAARHWLASGVPINVVSRWLGHASIQTTLIYLEILPDPVGYMERVE